MNAVNILCFAKIDKILLKWINTFTYNRQLSCKSYTDCVRTLYSAKPIIPSSFVHFEHDCPVPVDMHNSINYFTPSPELFSGVKGQLLKLPNS